MPAPGVTVTSQDGASSSLPSNYTGTAFIAGVSERGPVTPVLITNMGQFRSVFGERVAYGSLYDAVDIGLQEGLSRAYVQRTFGPTPVIATANLSDGASGTAYVVKAENSGTWGNSIKVTFSIPVGGSYKAVVEYPSGTIVETSPTVVGKQALIDWSTTSQWINLTDGGGSNPTAAVVTLATGTDDHANITSTEKAAAINKFGKDLGPGQVYFPGDTTDAVHSALADHAAANNRTYYADLADTHTVATLTTAATTQRALGNAKYGALLSSWHYVPGITSGTTRTVAPSIVQAGVYARMVATTSNPNEPAAGNNGVSRTSLGLTQAVFSDTERDTLNLAGVNIHKQVGSNVTLYGYRTPVDPFTHPNDVDLNNQFLEMAIKAGAAVVGERFEFRQIDGKGHMLSDFAGAIAGEVLLPLYQLGAIFGDTPAEAFSVDTGDQVNPIDQLEDRMIVAAVHYKPSPFAELVTINITKEDLS